MGQRGRGRVSDDRGFAEAEFGGFWSGEGGGSRAEAGAQRHRGQRGMLLGTRGLKHWQRRLEHWHESLWPAERRVRREVWRLDERSLASNAGTLVSNNVRNDRSGY